MVFKEIITVVYLFIYDLFYGTFSISDYIATNGRMINEG
jgi:hypothetical protein